MADVSRVANRIIGWRLTIWLAILALAYVNFASRYPLAWLVGALGAAVSLLWPAARHTLSSQPLPPLDDEETSNDEDARNAELSPEKASLPAPSFFPDVVLDLILVTALVTVSGGFSSVFAPLPFLVVMEAFALLGPVPAFAIACAAVLLSPVHFRLGVNPQAVTLYGMTTATLMISALIVAWSQRSESNPVRRSALLKTHTKETLEAELKELSANHEQLKNNYREVAQLNREQKTQVDRHSLSEQLFAASTTVAITDGDAGAAYAKLLRIVMERLDADGGVLWLQSADGNVFLPQAVEGRIAPTLREDVLTDVKELTPGELRSLCEERLRVAAPNRGSGVGGRGSEEGETRGKREKGKGKSEEQQIGERPPTTDHRPPDHLTTLKPYETYEPYNPVTPIVVVLLRDPNDDASAEALLGAVGVCAPRGATRFNQADAERLQSMAHPLAVALTNVEQRRGLQRRVRELSLLYDLSRLVQTATDMEQMYKAIIAQVQRVIPYENGTLFLLDKEQNRLEVKATQGRVVNLLDHISFEKGSGLSGWVAARGRQVFIPDLQKEPNLLNVEMIPPRVRSFVAMPLQVQNNVVGVINLSHSRPNAFTEADIQLLTILAGQAAVTIERTEVFHVLETLAITDGLTQVYNHRYFHRRLEDEIRRGKRYPQQMSLMMIDVDWFKRVNDQYGHASGDRVLRDLAGVLRHSVRETEILARYGGEEFAILLPQTDFEQALTAAERIRANVAAHLFSTADGQPLRVTVSVGVAAFPQHAETAPELLQLSDRALYAAKEGGRNRVCAASSV